MTTEPQSPIDIPVSQAPVVPPATVVPTVADLIEDMSASLARNWGWVALRGVLGIIIGVYALMNPLTTIAALVLLFVIYAIADGITGIVSVFRAASKNQRWGWLLVQAIISLGAAAVALSMPRLAVQVFLFVMAFWAILGGVALIIAALKLKTDHGRWWLGIGGALSILWGALLISQPLIGALVLTFWFGIYTLVFGIFFLILGFILRSRHKAGLA